MALRVALFGFGRVGRSVLRNLASDDASQLEIVAIDAPGSAAALENLVRFDTLHGPFSGELAADGDHLVVNGRRIAVQSHKLAGDAAWGEVGVDLVIDDSGRNTSADALKAHLDAGAGRVLLAGAGEAKTIVRGVNDDALSGDDRVIATGSFTANAVVPVASVLASKFTVKAATLTAVHAYTNEQRLADVPHKQIRLSRAAAANIIPLPEAREAADTVGALVPGFSGRITGMDLRVPVADGSCAQLVTVLEEDVDADAVNAAIKAASENGLEDILVYNTHPIVSSDLLGCTHSAVFDSLFTAVTGGNLVKTTTWFDNGTALGHRAVELAEALAAQA